MTERSWIGLGAVLAMLAVAAGAFATHGLRGRLSTADMETFQTAARYHMYHSLALLAVGYAAGRFGPGGAVTLAGWLFVAGTLLFSGSLYLLATSGFKPLGAVAPLGGLCLLGGWAALVYVAWQR